MSPTKKPPAPGGLAQLTVRLTPEQLEFLVRTGRGGPNENIRRVMEDARTTFGLPSPILERLAEEADALGIDFSTYEGRRELIIRCLTECYRDLLLKDAKKR
ncbi:MAG TPA: hypothetical protein VK447_01705 [Myxococcaceae bacterium]|nr:hypothetical protein [Myxococcaceae bacterium]